MASRFPVVTTRPLAAGNCSIRCRCGVSNSSDSDALAAALSTHASPQSSRHWYTGADTLVPSATTTPGSVSALTPHAGVPPVTPPVSPQQHTKQRSTSVTGPRNWSRKVVRSLYWLQPVGWPSTSPTHEAATCARQMATVSADASAPTSSTRTLGLKRSPSGKCVRNRSLHSTAIWSGKRAGLSAFAFAPHPPVPTSSPVAAVASSPARVMAQKDCSCSVRSAANSTCAPSTCVYTGRPSRTADVCR
mmetsp:Transcript_31965/g.85363  ORF Transcript_31965/g.85363 Transcript_31965/m.85363 type:complete len:247 (+) Transcript_31965:124-864(+)